MHFLQFFAGMTVTFFATFGWFYVNGGSLWQAVGLAVLAAWIVQTAYFLAVASMARRASKRESRIQPRPSLELIKRTAQGGGTSQDGSESGRVASSQAPR